MDWKFPPEEPQGWGGGRGDGEERGGGRRRKEEESGAEETRVGQRGATHGSEVRSSPLLLFHATDCAADTFWRDRGDFCCVRVDFGSVRFGSGQKVA